MKYSRKELRFWSNWVFIILITPLYSISLYGLSSSFHQFVTNPTEDDICQLGNSTTRGAEIEAGLGESELFYSLLVSATNFGAMVGGLVSGFLAGSVPYWYLWMVSIVSHIVAFIIYSLSYQGWLIMVSRLLSGYFLGTVSTLGYSYFTVSSQEYVDVKKEFGKTTDEKSAVRLRNYLYSFKSIAFSTGVLIGSSATVVFAQFESVNQFRAIGWFNLAYGVLALSLLVIMFHGEIKCKKTDQCFQFCPKKKKSVTSTHFGILSFFIVLSLLVLCQLERVRFAFVMTVFNPIASDSFGIDERGAAYLILSLSIPTAAGSILLIVLQKLKLSSQGIALLAIIITMLGYLTVTDWQTIPYDPCTEYSPFHHPNITQELTNYSLIISPPITKSRRSIHSMITQDSIERMQAGLPTAFLFDLSVSFSCKQAETNICDCSQLSSKCLRFAVDEEQTLRPGTAGIKQEMFQCKSEFDQKSSITFCVFLSTDRNEKAESYLDTIEESDLMADIESIDILPRELHEIARNNCIQANVTGHQCHWIPFSDIFKKKCEDCQPICRSVHQTLTFAQFIIGNSLLVLSSALQIVPVVAMLMNQSPEHIQGMVLGSMTALNSISRTVSPLVLDAVYEGMQKRIFLLTSLLAFIHVPFIIEVIVLYPKLGPKPKEEEKDRDEYKYTKLESISKDDDDYS